MLDSGEFRGYLFMLDLLNATKAVVVGFIPD